jgi:hypothetical protein
MEFRSGWQSRLTMLLGNGNWRIGISKTLLYNVEQWFHIQNKLSRRGYAFENTFTSVTCSWGYVSRYQKRRLNQAIISLPRKNEILDTIKWIMECLVKGFTRGEDQLVGIRNTHNRDEKVIHNFLGQISREETTPYQRADWGIILKGILKKHVWGGLNTSRMRRDI